MEDGVQGRTNKDHNRSTHNHIRMLQTQASSSSSYNTNQYLTSHIPLNNHSRLITKRPHKIRIIHIVPPEIIKTDKANFRDLVQRLTGRRSSAISSASNTGRMIKKHQMSSSQVSSSSDHINMNNYLLGFGGSNSTNSSNKTDFSSNEKSLYDDDTYNDHHEELKYLDVSSDHEILNGGLFKAKVEREEIMVDQNPFDTTEWGMKENKFENGFCIEGFLELDEWLSQDTLSHQI